MFDYLTGSAAKQRDLLPGQVENSEGGVSFALDAWAQFDRFLLLGTESGSYYASPRELTRENTRVVSACLEADGPRAVNRIVAISQEGRAPKNDPALFALALAFRAQAVDTRRLAAQALPAVARIGTHLFHFVRFAHGLGGWNRNLRRAVGNWYRTMPENDLAYQLLKYQSRDGWRHRDVLRLAHPTKSTTLRDELLHWAVSGEIRGGEQEYSVLTRLHAVEHAKRAAGAELRGLITTYQLPLECVPTTAQKDPAVWEALLPSMGLEALIRSLGRMSASGLLTPLSNVSRVVRDRLLNGEALREARLHPLKILMALKVYETGRGVKGSLTWNPVETVVDALDQAFYTAFKNVEPTGKRHLLALDVSSSMTDGNVAGMPGITPRVGSAAMALVTANVEPNYAIMGFTGNFIPLRISPRQRLDDVCRTINGLPFGVTDCAQPMLHALQNKIPVDTFVIYTDSETGFGCVHPHVALQRYRQAMGIPAKLVVVGMVSNGFTIADPNDAGMLDVVGFDAATPALLADFAR